MKNMLLAISILLLLDQVNAEVFTPGGTPLTGQSINQYDSVYFDISNAVYNGSTVEFPVYLKSDDVINALDFAFRYNHSHLEYDTIINLTSYIDPLAYYNSNDSTVRLTSYSLTQGYVNDTALFLVRFTLLNGQLCSNDLDSVSAMLNGDASAHLVTGCTTKLNETGTIDVQLFPNPAQDEIHFTLLGKSIVQIFDMHSRIVYTELEFPAGGTHSVNTSHLGNGIYLLKVSAGKTVGYSPIVILR